MLIFSRLLLLLLKVAGAIIALAILLLGLLLLYGLIFKFEGKRPENLGVVDSKLGPAPSTPNAVSSSAKPSDSGHYIKPITYAGTATEAIAKIKTILSTMPQMEILEQKQIDQGYYLYAQSQSKYLGFVDDVEFYADGTQIQIRSASRIGRSDLGVNRQRMEQIRKAFLTSQ